MTVETLRADLESALSSRDYERVVRSAVSAVLAGEVSVPDLYVRVLGPLLTDVGSSWARGVEDVWEEHLASHAVRTIVESLYLHVRDLAARVPRRGTTVLLACPEDEQHELGLRMLGDRFDLGGYDVVFLGADTPAEEIVAAARASSASLIALSISTSYERVVFRAFVNGLRAELPDIRIVVGGPAFETSEHWPSEDFLNVGELGVPGSTEAG